MKQPLAVRQFSDNGINHETRFWPSGTTLEESGWRLAKEIPMKTEPLKLAEYLATTGHGGDMAAFLETDVGAKVYADYKKQLNEGQTGSAAPETAPADTRRFVDDKAGASVRGQERSFNDRVDALLTQSGNVTPTEADRVAMAAKLVEAEPQLYADYLKSLRRATSGG